VIGSRRSLPNALGDTRTPGGAWRRLYSLRSTAGHPAHRRRVRTRLLELGYRSVTFNVSLQDRVEHVVGREGVGVDLAGASSADGGFSRTWSGITTAVAVAPPGEAVDEGLLDVFQGANPPAMSP